VALELTWRGKEFEQHLRNATAKGLQRATVFLHAESRRAVSKPNSGVKVRFKDQSKEAKDQRKAAGRNKTSRTVYPSPSKPGEPPKLRTGFGARNVVMEFDKAAMAGRVGVTANGMYMFYLEVGTRRIARRPWLMATLLKHLVTIGKLAATGGDE
jgi:hypothetical protein